MKGDVLYYLKHVPQGSLDLSRVKRQLIIIPMGNNRHILEESLWRWKHNFLVEYFFSSSDYNFLKLLQTFIFHIQRGTKWCAPGLVKFVLAVAYLLGLALPGAGSLLTSFVHHFVHLCIGSISL